MQVPLDEYPFLPTGEACDLIRRTDWGATALGAVADWPAALKFILATVTRSPRPTMLMWGPDLVQFYNDAYIARGGHQHPDAMGRRGPDCWRHLWPILGPQVEACMRQGRSSWIEDQPFAQPVNGRSLDLCYTYGVSPVVDETGAVRGTLISFEDTTARVHDARRRLAVQRLTDRLGEPRAGDPLAEAAAVLAEFPADLPWTGFYRLDPERRRPLPLHVAETACLDDALRERFARDDSLAGRLDAGEACLLNGLNGANGPSAGPAPPAAPAIEDCLLVPLRRRDGPSTTGFIAFGLNPRIAFDAAYLRFCTELAERIAVSQLRRKADEVRQKADRERDDLLTHAPIATAILTGRELLFTLANPMYLQVVQRESVVGKTYEEAFPELVDTPLPGILRQVYDSGEPYVSPEMPVLLDRSHGRLPPEETWFQFSLEPLRDDNHAVYALAAVCVELTLQVRARREAELRHEADQARLQEHSRLLQRTVEVRTAELLKANQDLARSRDEADAANRQKSAFLANMSHEIRTPLNAIIGLSHLMTKASADPLQLDRLTKVTGAGHHLLQVINDILDLSKIEAGALVLDERPFSLSAVVRDALDMVGDRARDKGLETLVDLTGTPDALTGDATRLTQVLINLLSNAVKFTQQGRVRLSVHETGVDGMRSQLRFEVQDTGPGIAADRLPALFHAFVQGDDSLARQHGGTGLGLALCRQLARAMGGDAGAESTPGVGSTFWVVGWFTRPAEPALPGDRPAAPTPASSDKLEAAVRQRHGGRRVLLAEDNIINRELAVMLLEMAGLAVDTAADGNIAVARAAACRYDLILMDVQMPELDGIEAAQRIRAQGQVEVPIIAMTANAFVEDREACLAAGMNDHLAKPVQPHQLYAALLHWLD